MELLLIEDGFPVVVTIRYGLVELSATLCEPSIFALISLDPIYPKYVE